MTAGGINIIVVGGGIGGLTAALALRRQGHHVRIIESSSWLRETGAAVLVPPNACRALTKLEFDLETVKPAAFRNALDYNDVDKAPPRYGSNGSGIPYPWATRGKCEKQFFLAHRVDYHEALKAACTSLDGEGPPVAVSLKTKVTDWDAEYGIITTEGGTTLRADLIVAADGVHSQAHKHVLGYAVPATPNGATNIRFILPTKALLDDPVTRPMLDDGDGVFSAYRSSSQKTPRVYIRRYPCRKYSLYTHKLPLVPQSKLTRPPSNTLQNFGAYKLASPNDQPPSLSTTSLPTRPQVSRSDLLALLQDFPAEFRALAQKTPLDEPLYLWQLADRAPLPLYQRGKLVLVGDAAHPMWSFQGQGAAQSVEDGAVLGTLLHAVTEPSQLRRRLELYDELRVGRTAVAQLLSRNPPQEESVAADVSERVRELVDILRAEMRGRSGIDGTEAWRFVRRLDNGYRNKIGEGVEQKQLATHDDISNFFWEYDCIGDAEEILKRSGLRK